MQIRSVGIDLGKTTFHLVALSAAGKVLLRKKFTQKQLVIFTANMQTSLIGMEACSGAHFLGRVLREQGHDVKLIPAQFVKPFVKSNKNDFLDAEAIAEAVDRQNMRFVPIKTDDQLDLQAMHRVRDRLVARRTVSARQSPHDAEVDSRHGAHRGPADADGRQCERPAGAAHIARANPGAEAGFGDASARR